MLQLHCACPPNLPLSSSLQGSLTCSNICESCELADGYVHKHSSVPCSLIKSLASLYLYRQQMLTQSFLKVPFCGWLSWWSACLANGISYAFISRNYVKKLGTMQKCLQSQLFEVERRVPMEGPRTSYSCWFDKSTRSKRSWNKEWRVTEERVWVAFQPSCLSHACMCVLSANFPRTQSFLLIGPINLLSEEK